MLQSIPNIMSSKGVALHVMAKTHAAVTLTEGLVLQKGRVHEVLGEARICFAAIVAGQSSGPIIWIGREKDVRSVHAGALRPFLNPGRILIITCLSRKELLWTAEQALRAQGAGVVIVEMSLGPDLTESRRLQLATEQSGGIGLVLISRRAQTSSAQTRWNCDALPIDKIDDCPKWKWDLTKNKAGLAGTWQVSWKGESHAPDYVRLVSPAAA